MTTVKTATTKIETPAFVSPIALQQEFERVMIGKFSRVPKMTAVLSAGASAGVARQLDIALMNVGFKLSRNLFEYVAGLVLADARALSSRLVATVRELVGDHVQHNVYFKNFPNDVPDTLEFWMGQILSLFFTGTHTYGRYQHSYEDMLAAHDEFIPAAKAKFRVLNLGKFIDIEILDLYFSLAASAIPLNADDQKLLAKLALATVDFEQPVQIPVREHRAIINTVRVAAGKPLVVDTVTDVLRLAVSLSGGDVDLQKPSKFKSLSRKTRRLLLEALNAVIEDNSEKLADVGRYAEQWKKLAQFLHPYEFKKLTYAQDVFAVARGDKKAYSLTAKAEMAFAAKNVEEAISVLKNAPGLLFRNLDRILIALAPSGRFDAIVKAVQAVIGKVSAKVILSVREYLLNRLQKQNLRVFANRKGTAHVQEDAREALDTDLVNFLFEIFDAEILDRLPVIDRLVVHKNILNVAIPLSDKTKASGFSVMPRGSEVPVTGEVLRFFMYWKQKQERTDYDLSALELDEKFQALGSISWTRLNSGDGVATHSGDLIEASDGATEFIDIKLKQASGKYIIPQVNAYWGESFEEVEESFFGFMERTPEQKGQPFEPATVRAKSDVRGKGKVALPVIFAKKDDGSWSAKWMHLYLNGFPMFNMVEHNRMSTAVLVRSIVERKYLTFEYLIGLLKQKATEVVGRKQFKKQHKDGDTRPVTFIGLSAPEDLPEGSKAYTLANLHELIPG